MLIKHFLIPHLLRDPLIGGFGWAKVSLIFCFRMPFDFVKSSGNFCGGTGALAVTKS
jgi:hypothetical protein